MLRRETAVPRGEGSASCSNTNTAIGFLAILVSAGSLLSLSPRTVCAQPDEVRIRALRVSSEHDSVEAVDLLGAGGMVIRGSLPEQFSQCSGPVGDVNGDGLADLALFWGTTGSIDFAELYLVFGRSDLPGHLNIDNIDAFASRIHREPAFPRWGGRPFISRPHTVPAGDLDGDGVGDFFIGQGGPPQEYSDLEVDPETTYSPDVIYLVYGAVDFPSEYDLLNPPAGFRVARFSSTKPNKTRLSDDMSAGGDLNGDGMADCVFGAPQAQMEGVTVDDRGPGRVYVLFGQEEPYTGLIDVEETGTTRPGVILHGDTRGQGFGYETSFVGDVNGDGFDDLLIAVIASETSPAVDNHVLLLYGSSNLPDRLGADQVAEEGYGVRFQRLPGGTAHPRQTLAPMGDINGDGLSDFVLGEPMENDRRGAVYVVFGDERFEEQMVLRSLEREGRAIRIGGESAEIHVEDLGAWVNTVDYDADGVLDLLFGTPCTRFRGIHCVGQVYVVKGPLPSGSWTVDDIYTGELQGALFSSELPEGLGHGVHNLGDMNGDGFDEILVAAGYLLTHPNKVEPGLSPDPSLYVVFGAGGDPRPLGFDEVLPSAGPLAGGSELLLLGRGFDGEVEVEIGGKTAPVLRVETSARLVVELPPGDSSGPVEVVVEREARTMRVDGLFRYVDPFYLDIDVQNVPGSGDGLVIDVGSGQPISSCHDCAPRAALLDFDGDGFGDVVVDSDDGVAIVYGRAGAEGEAIAVDPFARPPEGTARLRFSDRVGHQPFAAGDVNGDGKDDLVVVSDTFVTVVFGGERSEGSVEAGTLLEAGGASLIPYSGTRRPSASGAGDMDGDGLGDLLLYRPSLLVGPGITSGIVNVVRGRDSWPPVRSLALEPSFLSLEGGDFFGESAALVGDVDGDGLSEVLIGAPGLFWSDRGKSYLVFGKADRREAFVQDLLASGEALEITSVKDKDSLGIRVSAVGDFNGDGTPDLALAARAGSLEFAGESYVVWGGSDLRGAPPLELAELGDRGVRLRGEFGYDYAFQLAPAGDFNGDGRHDLLVSGGNLTSEDNPFPARSFVVFGGAQGLADLAKLGEDGFRIRSGEYAEGMGAIDFDADGFDDVVVRGDRFMYVIFGSGASVPFIRGDANRTGGIDLTDAIAVLNYLFAGTGELRCQDAADANDNGRVELTDAVYLLGHLFSGDGPAPPPPFPEPGPDPTEDGLTCVAGN